MTRWQYHTHSIQSGGVFVTGAVDTKRVSHDLNWYGEQGWELVSAFDTNAGHGGTHLLVFVFKRPIEEGESAAPPMAAD